MAETTRCYILELPRELRNYIYDELTHDVCISADVAHVDGDVSLAGPNLRLDGSYLSEVLLVNRQIHDEYAERVSSRARLFVSLLDNPPDSYEQGWRCSTNKLDLRRGFPVDLLKQVKRCVIFFAWGDVWQLLELAMLDSFISLPVSQPREQGELAWTPSKALCEELKTLLSRLGALLSESAHIRVAFDLDKYPDANDPYGMIGLEDVDGEMPSQGQMEANQSMFHRDTFLALATDDSVKWPKPGHLEILFFCTTPLYCTLAANSEEVMESRRAFQTGLARDLVLLEHENSTEVVYWVLGAQDEENSWRGFWPEMLGISVESADQTAMVYGSEAEDYSPII
ncbi:hypothetical protein LTR36_003311 [Oleoguttula mirabilis]|uniref:Uncharacterized protein n=1 Tax=Oleoguttula mirabilis TaxID=1507867 RepID=A0AAV9JXM4_9PEZI|nr:hypothetical protein LTR36_003311 [Oleoguttula mirabilis]